MRRVVIVACAALLLVLIYMKSRTSQDIPDCTAFRALSSGMIRVKISGDVYHPGIYSVLANSLTFTVIEMAQPFRPLKQNDSGIIAARLQDGMSLKLELHDDGSHVVRPYQMTIPEHLALKIPLDIKTMTESDFDCLPGIGPALAKRIIEYRQNNGGILRVEDLHSVDGIGEKKFKTLHGYFNGIVITK
jgi:competence protein ComEA